MRAVACGVSVLVTASACGTEIAPLLWPAGASAVVVVDDSRGRRLEAVVLPYRTKLDADASPRLTALLYPDPLEALDLPAGSLVPDRGGRLLPPTDRIYELASPDAAEWTRLDAAPPEIAELRIAQDDPCPSLEPQQLPLPFRSDTRVMAALPGGGALLGGEGAYARVTTSSAVPVALDAAACPALANLPVILERRDDGSLVLLTDSGSVMHFDADLSRIASFPSCGISDRGFRRAAASTSGELEVFALTREGQLFHWSETSTVWRDLDLAGSGATPASPCGGEGAVAWLGPGEAIATFRERDVWWFRDGALSRIRVAEIDSCMASITQGPDGLFLMLTELDSFRAELTVGVYRRTSGGRFEPVVTGLSYAGRSIHAARGRILLSNNSGGLGIIPQTGAGPLCVHNEVRSNDIDLMVVVGDRAVASGRSLSDSNDATWIMLP